jgi:adenylate cyclase
MLEIEHKFLIKNDDWKATASEGIRYQQGYISTLNETTVRVRIAGNKGYLTLKGPAGGEEGISRTEIEHEIPLDEARTMIAEFVDSPIIDKVRYIVIYREKIWEIDVFSGDNEGLVLAEIELHDEHEQFEIPSWAGACVSDDPRYGNYSLAQFPFMDWE